MGVLNDDAIHNLSVQVTPVDCLVRQGGVLALRPLIVHASSKTRSGMRRRALHMEYTASLKFAEGLELAAS